MLILKNEVKELFESYGMLEGLTVSRGQDKFVSICGKCGEPVLTITSVEVGSKLTSKERKILTEDYITPAMGANRDAILEYVELKKDKDIENKIEELSKGLNLKYDTDYRTPHTINGVSIHTELVHIRYKVKEDRYTIALNNMDIEMVSELQNIVNEAKRILPIYLDLLKKQKTRDDLLQEQRSLLTQSCGF